MLHPTWRADIDTILDRDLPLGDLSGLTVLVTVQVGFWWIFGAQSAGSASYWFG